MHNNVGLLGPPPGLRVQKLNSTTLYLSWNAPNTLRGIPISNYSVDIDNLVTVSMVTVFASVNQPSIDPNTTSLDLSQVGSIGYLFDPGCESLQFTVRAWNSVGEGASSVVLYTQGKIGICLFRIKCMFDHHRITSQHQDLHSASESRHFVHTV